MKLIATRAFHHPDDLNGERARAWGEIREWEVSQIGAYPSSDYSILRVKRRVRVAGNRVPVLVVMVRKKE